MGPGVMGVGGKVAEYADFGGIGGAAPALKAMEILGMEGRRRVANESERETCLSPFFHVPEGVLGVSISMGEAMSIAESTIWAGKGSLLRKEGREIELMEWVMVSGGLLLLVLCDEDAVTDLTMAEWLTEIMEAREDMVSRTEAGRNLATSEGSIMDSVCRLGSS
jgi:hypothetical protein